MHKKILLLSIPLVISNITVPLAGIVNTALIGHLHNSHFLAAIALGIALMNFICYLFSFFRMSMTGITAQNFGKQDFEEALLLVFKAIILTLTISIIIVLFKNQIYSLVCLLVKVDIETLQLLREFLNIAIYMVIFSLLNFVLLGFFIGIQKTKLIFYSSSLSTLIGILLSVYFVRYLELNVEGIAYSMLLSQLLLSMVLIGFVFVFCKQYKFSLYQIFKQSELFDYKSYIPFLKLNGNIFIRSICLLISINSFYLFSSYYGEATLAANSILVEIGVFMAMFLDALANATETLVGEAFVNKDKSKLRLVVYSTLLQCLLVSIVFVVFYALLYPMIIQLFTSIESVQIEINKYIIFSIIFPIFASLSYWADGVFVGMLKTVVMRNAMILSMLVYLTMVLLLSPLGNYGLWIAMLGFYLARAVLLMYPLKKYLN